MAMSESQFYGGSAQEARNSFSSHVRYPMKINGKLYWSFADYEAGITVQQRAAEHPLALDGASAPKASGDLLADVLDGEGTLPEPPRQ